MRILYVVPRYWPSVGGAQLLSRELIKRVGARHEVAVVTQFTSDRDSFVKSVVSAQPGAYLDGEIGVHRIGPRGLLRRSLRLLSRYYGGMRALRPLFALLLDRAIAPQLAAIVSTYRPDVVHAVHIGLVYSSETACRVAHRSMIPFVWTPYPHIEGNSGWRGPRFRRLYRESDAVVAMTCREKQWLIEYGAATNRVHVVPVGPLVSEQHDAGAFRRAHNLGEAPVVLFLGQKLPYKGYRQIVDAAPSVWDRVPDTRFVFVGPRTADSEECFAKVHDGRVVELPAVDAVEKNSALAACDVFCMPSVQESLGGVYLEAWSFRKPVIAARIDIAQEVIEEGRDGLLVAQEPQAIAKAILRLLESESERTRMGEAGFRKVQEQYDWECLVGKMERLYRDLIERRRD